MASPEQKQPKVSIIARVQCDDEKTSIEYEIVKFNRSILEVDFSQIKAAIDWIADKTH